MSYSIGDYVQYKYPNPINNNEHVFIGKIESISDEYIFIKNEKNIRLKVSFKNFDYISTVQNPRNTYQKYITLA